MKLSSPAPLLLAAAAIHASAQEDAGVPMPAFVCESEFPSSVETKSSATVSHEGAPWMQVDLSGSKLPGGSTITVSDGRQTETFTGATLAANYYWSGEFDADSLTVTLTAQAESAVARVNAYRAGVCEERPPESICGSADDRIPSTDVRVGRIGGCSGWLIGRDVFLQAGHCGAPSSSTRIHFTYGTGSALPEDQYAVSEYHSSDDFSHGTGYGHDFGIGRLSPNSQTGLLPGDAGAQGDWFTLGEVPGSTGGVVMRVTGYGTADVASRSQKTHTGGLTGAYRNSGANEWYLRYTMDTTGGNSGSPAIHDNTGHAIGIHTHGGCSASGGSNSGTRIDHPNLRILLEQYGIGGTTGSPTTAQPTGPPVTQNPTPTPAPTSSPVTQAPVTPCLGTKAEGCTSSTLCCSGVGNCFNSNSKHAGKCK